MNHRFYRSAEPKLLPFAFLLATSPGTAAGYGQIICLNRRLRALAPRNQREPRHRPCSALEVWSIGFGMIIDLASR